MRLLIVILPTFIYLLLAYFHYFKRIKVGLCDRRVVSVNPPYQLLNDQTNIYKI
jgi:hypothetical protein